MRSRRTPRSLRADRHHDRRRGHCLRHQVALPPTAGWGVGTNRPLESGGWLICHDMAMDNGGLYGRMLAGVALVGALGIGAAACSSGPSAAANGLCGSVFGAPPPADEMVAMSMFTIKNGESSGNSTLDHAASAWIKALNRHDTAAAASAEHQVLATCKQLNIPLGTYPGP